MNRFKITNPQLPEDMRVWYATARPGITAAMLNRAAKRNGTGAIYEPATEEEYQAYKKAQQEYIAASQGS